MKHQMNIDYASLGPEEKLQIMKEMGFQEVVPREHDVDCTSRQGSGPICDCLPGTTSFKPTGDVLRFLGETQEARVEFANRRQEYQNDGIGNSPGSWSRHLAKTAPRYNS